MPFHASNGGVQPQNLPTKGTTSTPRPLLDTFEMTSVQQLIHEGNHEARTEPPVVPGPHAEKREVLEYIHQQLDCFGREPLLLDQYEVLGPSHRATGGIVAMLGACMLEML